MTPPCTHGCADPRMCPTCRRTDDEVIQVCIHPALRPHLERWLASRGLRLFRMPPFEDDLPTYGTTFTDPPAREDTTR